jgi:hypothetical protein
MSATVRLKLDTDGIREVANSQDMAKVVKAGADEIAGQVRADVDAPVVVNSYVTDRQAAAVTIASDYGVAVHARVGVLTKAAHSVGADVTRTA